MKLQDYLSHIMAEPDATQKTQEVHIVSPAGKKSAMSEHFTCGDFHQFACNDSRCKNCNQFPTLNKMSICILGSRPTHHLVLITNSM